MQPPSIGKDFDGAYSTAGGIDRDKTVVGRWTLGVANGEALLLECLTERGGDLERFLVVDLGEQVDVFGRSGHESVRDHGSAAGEGEGGRFGQRERGAGDVFLQGVQRHALRLPCVRSR